MPEDRNLVEIATLGAMTLSHICVRLTDSVCNLVAPLCPVYRTPRSALSFPNLLHTICERCVCARPDSTAPQLHFYGTSRFFSKTKRPGRT